MSEETTNVVDTEAPRPIPSEMWEQIRRADTIAAEHLENTEYSHREVIIAISEQYGFTKDELIARGVITRGQKPAPSQNPNKTAVSDGVKANASQEEKWIEKLAG